MIENNTLILLCEVEGFPIPDVSWKKDGDANALLTDSGIQLLSEGEQLIIQRANLKHAGSYACSATNKMATTGITYHVNVILRPRLILSDDNGQYDQFIEVFQGSSVTFTCPVKESNFDENITWLKNSEPIIYDSIKFTTISSNVKMTLLK